MLKELCTVTSVSSKRSTGSEISNSERGVALVLVIVLTAVALAIMTTLIYMITTGTRLSGLQKRYKTSLEASKGGAELFYQVIALRGEDSGQQAFLNTINAFNLNAVISDPTGTCSGWNGGMTYHGIKAKMMTSSTTWAGCSSSITINPLDPSSYDMKLELGTSPKYTAYAKIVRTSDGNSGGDEGLLNKGVVSANTGEVAVMSLPYLYAIEVVTENAANPDERAKLSILYQY